MDQFSSKNTHADQIPSSLNPEDGGLNAGHTATGEASEVERKTRFKTLVIDEDYKGVIKAAKSALKDEPDDIFYYLQISKAHMALEDFHKAEWWARRLLDLAPASDAARRLIGVALDSRRQSQRAEPWLLEALQINRVAIENVRALIECLHNQGRFKDASRLVREYLVVDPSNRSLLQMLIETAKKMGEHDVVEDTARQLQMLDVEKNAGILQLVSVIKFNTSENKNYDILRKILDKIENTDDTKFRSHLYFAAAKAAEDLKSYDTAFEFYKLGGELRIESDGYTDQDLAAQMFNMRKNTAFIRGWEPSGYVSKTHRKGFKLPIMIVGMPRSGTSVTEQILSSHPEVFGAGELIYLGEALRQSTRGKRFASGDVPAIARQTTDRYLKRLSKEFGDKEHIVDKMPGNISLVPYLLHDEPDIKVIRMKRDPMAVVWSCFKQNFHAVEWASKLSHVITYYEGYRQQVSVIDQKFPGRIYELDYDKLTENQEEETRKLLDFCGLGFDQSCIDFHKTKRGVATASSLQVTKPMYAKSSQSWRKFEESLRPYADILYQIDKTYD